MTSATGDTGATIQPATSIDPRVLSGGLIISQSIYVVVRLGIPDLLADGPKSIDDLARLTASHASSLFRVLRLLTALSLFVRHVGLAPAGERFRSNVPGSLRNMSLATDFVGGLKAYDHLLEAVREGRSAFEIAYGMGAFEFMVTRPETMAVFNAGMTERTAALAPTVASRYDFRDAELVIDIGGNQGTMLAGIVRSHPGMRGIVFDLPEILAGADAQLTAAGVADRCETLAGDFFKAIPGGGDYYLMANVLHDWDDAQAEMILRNCVRAMPPRAKVLVIERAISGDHNKIIPALISDINMMVQSGGRERTDDEYAALFESAGMRLNRVIPVGPPYAIFEGTPTRS